MSTRTFIALRLPDEALDELERRQVALVEAIGERARAVARDQLHATLAFLGNREDDEQPMIAAAATEAFANEEPFALELASLATYGGGGVLAYDLTGPDVERLKTAQGRLERDLVGQGLQRDEGRPWKPHLSVVRRRGTRGPKLRPPTDVAAEPLSFTCDVVEVVASVPAGPRREYRALHVVPLG